MNRVKVARSTCELGVDLAQVWRKPSHKSWTRKLEFESNLKCAGRTGSNICEDTPICANPSLPIPDRLRAKPADLRPTPKRGRTQRQLGQSQPRECERCKWGSLRGHRSTIGHAFARIAQYRKPAGINRIRATCVGVQPNLGGTRQMSEKVGRNSCDFHRSWSEFGRCRGRRGRNRPSFTRLTRPNPGEFVGIWFELKQFWGGCPDRPTQCDFGRGRADCRRRPKSLRIRATSVGIRPKVGTRRPGSTRSGRCRPSVARLPHSPRSLASLDDADADRCLGQGWPKIDDVWATLNAYGPMLAWANLARPSWANLARPS